MRRLLVTALIMLASSAAMAQTKEPIALRDIGSFHLGVRYVDISGKPTREVTIGDASTVATLKDVPIMGNSHFPMMEKNNAEVADVVHKWLAGKGLVD